MSTLSRVHWSGGFWSQDTSSCTEIGDINFDTEINNLCFHEGDLSVLQKMIDNSYATGFTEENCNEGDPYCGSPNPYMDELDAWFWAIVDSVYYQSGTYNGFQNGNGIVEPLELGLQEWNNGRLTSLMCGAYIYCQLSGPIPEEINLLTEVNQLRFEYKKYYTYQSYLSRILYNIMNLFFVSLEYTV